MWGHYRNISVWKKLQIHFCKAMGLQWTIVRAIIFKQRKSRTVVNLPICCRNISTYSNFLQAHTDNSSRKSQNNPGEHLNCRPFCKNWSLVSRIIELQLLLLKQYNLLLSSVVPITFSKWVVQVFHVTVCALYCQRYWDKIIDSRCFLSLSWPEVYKIKHWFYQGPLLQTFMKEWIAPRSSVNSSIVPW